MFLAANWEAISLLMSELIERKIFTACRSSMSKKKHQAACQAGSAQKDAAISAFLSV